MYIGTHGKDEVFRLFGQHVSSGKARFFSSVGIDFVLGRREGPWLWDITGARKLIDTHCNGGVFNLGHRHPEVVATMRAALDELDIGNHHLVSEQRAALAARLAALMPGDLSYTVFGVSGGEAVDLAIKVARAHTGRSKIVSAAGAYHGHTGLALAAGDEKFRTPFGPQAPGFVQVPFDDLAALDRALDDTTAAVILETIPATFGVCVPADGYLAGVRALCDRRGVLWIADEVQTGLGRTGRMWGFEHDGVVPDIVVLGKGLSGGIFPMAATCFRAPIEHVFHADPFIHVSTFGGAELGCPVAAHVLQVSSDPAFLQNVRDVAAVFTEGFRGLATRHEVLVRLRQRGLMMGIEMVNEMCGPVFTKAAFDHGLLSIYAANNRRVAQLLPPLTTDRSLAEEILRRVDAALGVVGALLRR
ncbi:MAG: aminotransferase class III-fold pyridoxal phosphate-dependent enzyme [Steroidobacteraceae bacterium]